MNDFFGNNFEHLPLVASRQIRIEAEKASDVVEPQDGSISEEASLGLEESIDSDKMGRKKG